MKKLDADFEEQFSACFDERYQQDINKVQAFISTYEKKVNTVVAMLDGNKSSAYPKINFSVYDDKVRAIKATIELNKKRLAEKMAAPATTISLEKIDIQIAKINALIDDFNSGIKKYNEIIGSRKAKQAECIASVWQHMAFLVKPKRIAYEKKLTANKDEIYRRRKI